MRPHARIGLIGTCRGRAPRRQSDLCFRNNESVLLERLTSEGNEVMLLTLSQMR